MFTRRHFKQTESLTDRLAAFAKIERERAELLPPGADKNAALAKASQADEAMEMGRWMRSLELNPPK